MEGLVAACERLTEATPIGPMVSLGDADITKNNYLSHEERVAHFASLPEPEITAEGRFVVAREAWDIYLSQVDVNDDRTPGERLAEYFGESPEPVTEAA